jgi:hypothetical protein
MGASFNSPSQQVHQYVVACIQAVFTGTPDGTLKLQISNDDTNWTDYTGSSEAISGAGNFAWNIINIGFQYVRLVYTRSSSTGSLSATVSGKGP